jgi:hypothetical protein
MNKSELLTLMEFVCDKNKQSIFEIIKTQNMDLSEAQIRALLQTVDANTKNCFFRMIEKI